MKSGQSRLAQRITVALTSIVVIFVVVQGYLAYTALADQEDDLVNQIVEVEAQRLIGQLDQGDNVLPDDGGSIELTTRFTAWMVMGPPAEDLEPDRRLPEALARLPDGTHVRQDSAGHTLHYRIETTPQGRFYLRYDASEDEAFVYRFGFYLLVIGSIICAIAAITSVAIARILVEPFRRMASHLSEWTPGHAPLPIGQSDEEAMLLEAFDAAQRRLDESYAREREFVANVRHEVRTPLTALRTDAEMLLLTQTLDDGGRARLQRMQATVDAIAADIESVHNLSNAQLAEPEIVDLRACIDAVWAGLQHRNVDGRLELVNEIPRGDTANIDRLALMTILRNLLRNAIDHATPGHCTVGRLPDGLRLADEGPGIAAEDLPRIFDRHFSRHRLDTGGRPRPPAGASSDERGLGLAIARQTALAHRWSLDVRSSPGSGTVFTLRFDPAPAGGAAATEIR
ncbi:MAG: HAMP domain-containing sensor histidine kinase [Burkholderiaceae bacterium]